MGGAGTEAPQNITGRRGTGDGASRAVSFTVVLRASSVLASPNPMKHALALSLAALVLGAGCDSATAPSTYTSTIFTLTDASLPPEAGVTELTPSTITFAPDGTLAVSSCNDCGGRYVWDSNVLRVEDLVCTDMACGARLDLGLWLTAERVVVSHSSDADDREVTLVAERDGLLASFLFRVSGLD